MTQLSRRMFHFNVKRKILWQVSVLRRYLRSFWVRFLSCWVGKSSIRYRQLSNIATTAATFSSLSVRSSSDDNTMPKSYSLDNYSNDSSDLVPLKISLLGDYHTGKTSFLTKYVGGKKGGDEFTVKGVNQVDKTMCVKGARISYSIWEVNGDKSSHNQVPAACKDSVAMLFMFDLTSRRTLNSVITWYKQARKCNQNAIPVLIGTKFDDFVQLPIDLQWAIASQARAYAKALNATLFFSSATYNINVNKVFKFVTAKLFNLPWNLERNLTIGEPMIDF